MNQLEVEKEFRRLSSTCERALLESLPDDLLKGKILIGLNRKAAATLQSIRVLVDVGRQTAKVAHGLLRPLYEIVVDLERLAMTDDLDAFEKYDLRATAHLSVAGKELEVRQLSDKDQQRYAQLFPGKGPDKPGGDWLGENKSAKSLADDLGRMHCSRCPAFPNSAGVDLMVRSMNCLARSKPGNRRARNPPTTTSRAVNFMRHFRNRDIVGQAQTDGGSRRKNHVETGTRHRGAVDGRVDARSGGGSKNQSDDALAVAKG